MKFGEKCSINSDNIWHLMSVFPSFFLLSFPLLLIIVQFWKSKK